MRYLAVWSLFGLQPAKKLSSSVPPLLFMRSRAKIRCAAQQGRKNSSGGGSRLSCRFGSGARVQGLKRSLDDGVYVGAESELVSITLRNFGSGHEMTAECVKGTDLRYFRGEISTGQIMA